MEVSSQSGDGSSDISSWSSRAATSATSLSPGRDVTLDQYLALGCLCFGTKLLIESDHEDCEWDDLEGPTPSSLIDATLFTHIQELVDAGWIRLQSIRGVDDVDDDDFVIWRVYILPYDACHNLIDRQNKKLWNAFESLVVAHIDVSNETWRRGCSAGVGRQFDPWAKCDDGSLFYMFNKLPSPSPVVKAVKEKYAREALEDLLDPASVLPGLQTILYPYQRRSAGAMLQRESVVRLELDPRLEERVAPDGKKYYYDVRELLFFRQPRYYECCQGGILAETMGLGKTVIL